MARVGAASSAARRRSLAAQRCLAARPATSRSGAARCEGVAMEDDIRVITGRGGRRWRAMRLVAPVSLACGPLKPFSS